MPIAWRDEDAEQDADAERLEGVRRLYRAEAARHGRRKLWRRIAASVVFAATLYGIAYLINHLVP